MYVVLLVYDIITLHALPGVSSSSYGVHRYIFAINPVVQSSSCCKVLPLDSKKGFRVVLINKSVYLILN